MTPWEDMPEGTEDIREAFGAELERMERERFDAAPDWWTDEDRGETGMPE